MDEAEAVAAKNMRQEIFISSAENYPIIMRRLSDMDTRGISLLTQARPGG